MNILLVKTGKENKMMSNDELKAIGCTPIEDLITEDFDAIGTEERNEFENGCEAFIIGEQLKAERLKAGMTQEQLAAKIGTKKVIFPVLKMDMQIFSFPRCLRYFKGLDVRLVLL